MCCLHRHCFMKSLRETHFLPFQCIRSDAELCFSGYVLPIQIIADSPDHRTLIPLHQEAGSFQLRHQRFVRADGTSESTRLQTTVHTINDSLPFRYVIRESCFKLYRSGFIRKQTRLPESHIRKIPTQAVQLHKFIIQLFVIRFFFRFPILLLQFLQRCGCSSRRRTSH